MEMMLGSPDRGASRHSSNNDGDWARRRTASESAPFVVSQFPEPSQLGRALLEEALVDVDPDRVGWFRFYHRDERWEWSPQVHRMHGHVNGGVAVTTELVLSHTHSEDRPRVAAMIDDIRRTHRLCIARYRIVDIGGAVHHVVVVGGKLCEDSGEIVGTRGFYIDVTLSERDRNDLLTTALATLSESRAVIEQAKGMLMVIYRMDADRAFEILRWRSRQTNVKLRLIADQVCEELRALEPAACIADAANHILMTAHLRVKPQ
jgi:hypothetical protein